MTKQSRTKINSFFVYIVQCLDKTYYTGYTNNLERRLKEHNQGGKGGAKYLRGRTPVELVYTKEYKTCRAAMRAERDMKKRTRKEKEEVINALPRVAH